MSGARGGSGGRFRGPNVKARPPLVSTSLFRGSKCMLISNGFPSGAAVSMESSPIRKFPSYTSGLVGNVANRTVMTRSRTTEIRRKANSHAIATPTTTIAARIIRARTASTMTDSAVRIATAMAACLIALSGAQTSSNDEPIYVGILEPSVSDTPISNDLNGFRVRVAFKSQNGRWGSMPHDASSAESLANLSKLYPSKLAWTLALDGKKVGAMNSVQPPSYTLYSEVGLQELTPDSKPPAVRGAFQTWMGPSNFRPLVAISRPNYGDPDHWKPIRPLPPLSQQARTAFRKAIALDLSCNDKPSRGYPDEYIQLRKAYRSDRGDVLLALRANPARNPYGVNDGAWDSVWFLIRNADFHLIGSELMLVDASAFNGAVTAEVILHLLAY